MKKTILSTLALVLVLCGGAIASAQDKPAAIVSIASYKTLLTDVDFVGQLGDAPDLSKGLEGLISVVTQGKGLKGFDKTKPLGAAVYISGGAPMVVGFIPVTDLKAMMSLLPVPAGETDGVFEVNSPDGKSLFATQKGGWAFLSNDKAALKLAPADPEKVLDGLDKSYAVAVRINVQNIPAEMRDMGILLLKSGLEANLRQNPGEDDDAFELRRKVVEGQMKQFETEIKELDQLTLGWAINPTSKTTHLDISTTAVAGSEMAKSMGQAASTTSSFTGFQLAGSAMNLNMSAKIPPTDAEQLLSMTKTLRTKVDAGIDRDASIPAGDGKTAVKQLASDLIDIAESTIKAGKLDGGAALVLEPNALSFAAGGFVKDGTALETAIKKLVALGAGDPNFPKVTFDAETHKGIRMHTLAVPVKDDPGAQKVFGDTLNVTVGIGNQSAYVAFGKGGMDLLKKVIDASAAAPSQPGPPMQLNIALTPILNFANSMQPNPQVAMVAQLLAATPGKDHIRLTATTISNGMNYRIQVEEGILKAVGAAAKAQAGGGGGAPRGFGPPGQ